LPIKASPEAQAWFDQGLSLLHDFWDYESAKAFEQAIRVDPKCAMCWWGLARRRTCAGPKQSLLREEGAGRGVKLKDHASGTDKLYIEAAEAESEPRAAKH
jgi:hypothetical protein